MDKTHNGSQIVWSLAVLVATLAFVYTIFFELDKPQVTETASASEVFVGVENADSVAVPVLENQQDPGTIELIQPVKVQGEVDKNTQPVVEANLEEFPELVALAEVTPVVENGKTFFSVQELFADVTTDSENEEKIPLEGTFEREGQLRSLDEFGLLGLEKYVLKTVYNSHFVFMGDYDNKNIPGIATLNGNIVEIEGKNSIQGHGLFGDRVRFLNTQRYKDLDKVVFMVFFEETSDAWFVQMDRDRYYEAKPLIKQLFEQRYD